MQHRIGGAVRRRSRPRARRNLAPSPATGEGLVLVGTSTGGPPALEALLSSLPANFSVAHPRRPAHAGELHRAAGEATRWHLARFE